MCFWDVASSAASRLQDDHKSVFSVIAWQRGNTLERPPEYFREPHREKDILLWLELVVEDIQNKGRTLKVQIRADD